MCLKQQQQQQKQQTTVISWRQRALRQLCFTQTTLTNLTLDFNQSGASECLPLTILKISLEECKTLPKVF